MDQRVVLYDYALKHVGIPYKWGGNNPLTGFDCSGLVIDILQAAGVMRNVDMTAAELMEHFKSKIPEADFGALVFFGAGTASHVGFALNKTLMLEAGGGDHTVTSRSVAEEKGACVRIRPIARRNDLLAICWPPYPWK